MIHSLLKRRQRGTERLSNLVKVVKIGRGTTGI